METAATLDKVSDLVHPFVDPDNGVVAAVASVLWAAAHQAEANVSAFREDDPAYVLWHTLAAAAEHLGDIGRDTSVTSRIFTLIDSVIPVTTAGTQGAVAFTAARDAGAGGPIPAAVRHPRTARSR